MTPLNKGRDRKGTSARGKKNVLCDKTRRVIHFGDGYRKLHHLNQLFTEMWPLEQESPFGCHRNQHCLEFWEFWSVWGSHRLQDCKETTCTQMVRRKSLNCFRWFLNKFKIWRKKRMEKHFYTIFMLQLKKKCTNCMCPFWLIHVNLYV